MGVSGPASQRSAFVSVSVYAGPTDSVRQLAEFRVGMQAREGGLASQLDEIRVVFPVGSLQPFEGSLRVVDRPIDSCDVVRRHIAVTTFAALLHDSLHSELVSRDSVRLRQ